MADFELVDDFRDALRQQEAPGVLPASSYADEASRPGGTERNLEVGREIVERLPLTEAAKDALIIMSDPFHDREVRCGGYPDGAGSRVIVQTVRKQLTLAAPAGLAPGAKWDLHIATTPLNYTTQSTTNTLNQNILNVEAAAYADWRVGTVTAIAVPTGAVTWPSAAIGTTPGALGGYSQAIGLTDIGLAAPSTAGYTSTDTYMDGPGRMIGLAFEAHNNTALLTADGSVTVYRQDSLRNEEVWLGRFDSQQCTDINGAALVPPVWTRAPLCYGVTAKMKGPPATVGEATLIPSSRTYSARKGAYVVGCAMDERCFDFASPEPRNGVFLSDEAKAGWTLPVPPAVNSLVQFAGYNKYYNVPSSTAVPVATAGGARYAAEGGTLNGFMNSGAYFTGLDETTVITLVVRMIQERVPVLQDDLITLAQIPPERDEAMYGVLKELQSHLPPGCPVADNFLGTFFKAAARATEDALDSPYTAMGMDAAEAFGGKKGKAGARIYDQLQAARDEDQKAGRLQRNAARRRKRAGVKPSRAGDEHVGLDNTRGRSRRRKRDKKKKFRVRIKR